MKFDELDAKLRVYETAHDFCVLLGLFADKVIGYPLIGAGLAKGDWQVISKIIDTELAGTDHTLVKFAG